MTVRLNKVPKHLKTNLKLHRQNLILTFSNLCMVNFAALFFFLTLLLNCVISIQTKPYI